MMRRLLPFAALCVLAGCDKEAAPAPTDDNRSAAGNVQGGTISDAMLPLDTVTSAPPTLRPAANAARDDANRDPQAAASGDTAEDASGTQESASEAEAAEPTEAETE